MTAARREDVTSRFVVATAERVNTGDPHDAICVLSRLAQVRVRLRFGHMSELIVRRALQADVPAAARLGTAIVQHHHATDPERFFWFDGVEGSYLHWLSREIEREDAVVLVATRNEQVVGYAYGAIEARDWSVLLERHGALHDLFVVPEERRNGVGRQLVAKLIEELTQLGATLFVLRAMVQNEPAQRLAASFGFRASMLEMSLSVRG